MAYDGKILARARLALEQQQRENQAEQQRRLRIAYRRSPELAQIDAQLRSQMSALVRLALSHAPDIEQRVAALEQENLDLQARRAELLTEQGWPIDYLDEIISCPICRDSGMDGNEPCQCLLRLYNRELTRELSALLRRGDESFAHFDLSLYDEEPLPGGVSPREAMDKVYRSCVKFADSFPEVSSSLLFQGGTGLGKTYLSACIARAVADKGYSVCYDSASAAFDCFETLKFSRDTDAVEAADRRIQRMLDCDLMILDDLGTELVTSLSVNALYTLINTRLVRGKKTIISTNLSDEELKKRYTPAIFSRLKGEFLRLPFVGRDIRLRRL